MDRELDEVAVVVVVGVAVVVAVIVVVAVVVAVAVLGVVDATVWCAAVDTRVPRPAPDDEISAGAVELLSPAAADVEAAVDDVSPAATPCAALSACDEGVLRECRTAARDVTAPP